MNRRILKVMAWSAVGVGVLVSGSVAVRAVVTDAPAAPSPAPSAAPRYVPDQLIVKYKDTVGVCVHCLFKDQRGSFRQAVADPAHAQTLEALHQRFKVQAVKPVFRSEAEETSLATRPGGGVALASLKQQSQRRLEEVKRKFPKRTRRVPENATLPDLSHVYVLSLAPGTDVEEAVAVFQDAPEVAYAQPNYLVEAQWIPNDPYYSSSNSWGQGYDDLWGLKKIHAEQAWDLSKGQGIVVGVIDTGVDYTHPDLAANIWVNPGEDLNHNGRVDGSNTCPTPNGDFNCVDDDANGYVDDIRGWDFGDNDNNPMDNYGHGTHVSGTIAAVGNNGVGIIGIAPQAKIMAVKGFATAGVTAIDMLANAIVYGARNGADVLNNSWGCSGPCSSNPVAEDAIRTAYGLGVVAVFSAGNMNADATNYSPQNMRETITVAATDHLDQRSGFSNYGMLVDLAAPGGESGAPCYHMRRNILSLRAANTDMYWGSCGGALNGLMIVGTSYYRASGTSMSAPHVAGVAALVLAYRPTFTNEDVRQALQVSADDLGEPGVDLYTGFGRVNAARALSIDQALRAVITSPGSGSAVVNLPGPVTITGTASGAGFLRYDLLYAPATSPQGWTPIGGPVFSAVENGFLGTWPIGGLPMGRYAVRLIATSAAGLTFQDTVSVSLVEEKVRQITTNLGDQYSPAISGARIVWEDNREVNEDIYLYDLMTSREWRITTDPSRQKKPAISGNRIVWEDFRNGNYDIYLCEYDPTTGACPEQRITTNPSDQRRPAISGNRIVWLDTRNTDYFHIYACEYDPMTGACPERYITTSVAPEVEYSPPGISGDRIVWVDYRNGNNDIYLYNLATDTERQITTDPGYQTAPAISGDRIVWVDRRNGNNDIYLYDLVAGQERQITSHPASQAGPAISRSGIVWTDSRNGNNDIYLYDLVAGQERQITSHPASQAEPAISRNGIVWTDSRNGIVLVISNKDIYLYDGPPMSAGAAPLLDPIGDKNALEGQELIFTVSATDPDGDPLTYSASGLPSGAQLSSQTFRWVPGFDQAGSHPVTFTASDDQLSDSEVATITVTDVPLALLSLSDSPDPFTPNGDGVDDTTTIAGSFNHVATWTVEIRNSLGSLVRTFSGLGTSISQVWDGKNTNGLRVMGGTYTYTLRGTDVGGSTVQGSGTVTLLLRFKSSLIEAY